MYELHLIASCRPHVNHDMTACLLSTHDTAKAAHAEGRRYLAEHPDAWCQVQDADHREDGEDVQP